MTPRQFSRLSARHKYDREHQEFMFGQLTSWVANTGFRSTKEPTKPSDFMPCMYSRKVKTVRKKRRSRQAIAGDIRAVMGLFMKKKE